jgi:hypothetical protein
MFQKSEELLVTKANLYVFAAGAGAAAGAALLGSDFLQPTPAAASTIASAAIQREMRSLLVGIGLLLLTEFPWLEQTGKFALSQRNGELI